MSKNTSGQYRRGTTYKVSFPNLPSLDVQPTRVELHQRQYNHDVLKFKFFQTSGFWFSLLKTGEPVKFEWSRGELSGEWFGYVYLVSKESAGQRKLEMEVQCLGVTFPLKQQVNRVFENSTVTEVVKTIASEHGLNFIGENDSRRFSQLTITGQSYWEWMTQQAKKIGYGLVVDGISLTFRPLDKLIDQSMNNVPIFSMFSTDIPAGANTIDRTLDYFKVLYGEHMEHREYQRSVKHVGGVDPISGAVVTTFSSPDSNGVSLRSEVSDVLFSEFSTEHVVNDLTAAETMADAAASLGRFNIPAKAKTQGDSRVRPFSPIYVEGTGDMTDGYWMVEDVVHIFAKIGDYQLELEVMSDGLGKNNSTPFRPEASSRVGIVNVTGKDEVSVFTPNARGQVGVKLDVKDSGTLATSRGYLRTPSRWIATGV